MPVFPGFFEIIRVVISKNIIFFKRNGIITHCFSSYKHYASRIIYQLNLDIILRFSQAFKEF